MMRSGELYEIQLHRKGHPIGVRIWRANCACTIGGPFPHDWTPECDRYPPLVLLRADGTEMDLAQLRDALQGHDFDQIVTAKRIGQARHRYLVDLELWALAHNPRHPIARPDRRARKWRTFLDD